MSNIPDGTSNTLLIGERPPSTDFWYGWWYAGVGMEGSGAPDFLLGVREVRTNARFSQNCATGPFHFQPGQITDQCDAFHFWSPHPGGAHFAMCDGSVHFLSYSADRILPALATRASGEAVELP